MRRPKFITLILFSLAILGGGPSPARAQAAAQAAQPATGDESGFESIFDGRTLKGWAGDPKYWRVEGGALVGEVTPETLLKQNSFIIWRGGVTRDFELKVEYRVSARGNSGINYRSVEVAGQPFALRGYQADIDGQNRNAGDLRHTGQNYNFSRNVSVGVWSSASGGSPRSDSSSPAARMSALPSGR